MPATVSCGPRAGREHVGHTGLKAPLRSELANTEGLPLKTLTSLATRCFCQGTNLTRNQLSCFLIKKIHVFSPASRLPHIATLLAPETSYDRPLLSSCHPIKTRHPKFSRAEPSFSQNYVFFKDVRHSQLLCDQQLSHGSWS